MLSRQFAIVAVAILTVGLAAAIGNNRSQADQAAIPPIEMHIRRGASDIEITGQVSSPAHEGILLEILGRQDSPLATAIDFTQADLPPPGWALLTELALQATLLTRFSETTVDANTATIRGVTSDPVAWAVAIRRLRSALLPGMSLENQVVEIAPAPEFTSLCRKQFAAAIGEGPLQFAARQIEIDSQSRAMLDRLNETAADCTRWSIKVLVRGDGSPPIDSDLATARAQSIIDYLTARGLPLERIRISTEAGPSPGRYGQADFLVDMESADRQPDEVASDAFNSERSPLPTAAPLAN